MDELFEVQIAIKVTAPTFAEAISKTVRNLKRAGLDVEIDAEQLRESGFQIQEVPDDDGPVRG